MKKILIIICGIGLSLFMGLGMGLAGEKQTGSTGIGQKVRQDNSEVKPNITKEDKEVIRMMELLELMDVLENMDMIKDLSLFIEEDK